MNQARPEPSMPGQRVSRCSWDCHVPVSAGQVTPSRMAFIAYRLGASTLRRNRGSVLKGRRAEPVAIT
jgi:hypothetical protein